MQLSNGYKLQKLGGSTSASLPNVTSAWIKASGSKSFSSGSVLGPGGGAGGAAAGVSRSAQSHAFRKLKTPARCKECDSYLYFYGLECHEVSACTRAHAAPSLPLLLCCTTLSAYR